METLSLLLPILSLLLLLLLLYNTIVIIIDIGIVSTIHITRSSISVGNSNYSIGTQACMSDAEHLLGVQAHMYKAAHFSV